MNRPHGQPPAQVEIPRLIGNVRLGEELGRGTGGVVFAGHDVMLDRPVAVKVLSQAPGGGGEAELSRFIEGVRSAAAVKHGNILTVYAVDSVEGRPIIVMEHVDGMSLRALLRRAGPAAAPHGGPPHAGLEPGLAVYVIGQIADAVAALHDAHIIHRDLKPANVLIDRDGGTHVCDFGLACRLEEAAPIAEGEGVSGTPLYMAPEMFDGAVSTQSDVYALGAMFFEILCGRPPFSADSMEEMKSRHAREPLPVERLSAVGGAPTVGSGAGGASGAAAARLRSPVSDEVVQELTEIIERAMHKNRILRYKTARHFLRAVEEARLGSRQPHLQRQKLAALVVGGVQARLAEAQATEPPAQTVAELVARRAQAKRQGGEAGT